METCIDFSRSSVSWMTKSGSVGRFRVIASLTAQELEFPFYLGAPVMAGDVYGDGLLPRLPPYVFIWATDGRVSRVFRIDQKHQLTTEIQSDSIFSEIKLNLKFLHAEKFAVEALISQGLFFNNCLVCRIKLEDQAWEFPVLHLNTKLDTGEFQVETGPILTLIAKQLLPSFLFFNSTNACQLVTGYPGLTSDVIRCNSEIEFLAHA